MSSWIDIQYIRMLGSQLGRFKENRNNLWNFRCPVCGDSDKKTSAHGYLFAADQTFMFKCQKCGDARPFVSLLKIVSPELHKQYRMDMFKETTGTKTRAETPKPKFKRTRRIKPKSDTRKPLPKQLLNFEPVSELHEDHIARRYVNGRQIPQHRWNRLFYAENIKVVAKILGGYDGLKFDNFPRLLLPFIDQNGTLTHIQGRAIGNNIPSGSRYYTLEVEPAPKVYGLDRIDSSKEVLVVEGPIDSLFLENCVGMGGSDIPWELFDPSKTTFVWDNEPRSKIIVKHMRQAVERKFKVCVWGNNITQKDINDMVKSGRSPEWLVDYIHSHSFSGLKAKMAIAQYEI